MAQGRSQRTFFFTSFFSFFSFFSLCFFFFFSFCISPTCQHLGASRHVLASQSNPDTYKHP